MQKWARRLLLGTSVVAIAAGLAVPMLPISALGAVVIGNDVMRRYVLPFAASQIARGDVLYCVAPEGMAKAIGKSADEFGKVPLDHFVMSWKGYHLNDPGFKTTKDKEHLYDDSKPPWEVLKNDKALDPEVYEIRSPFERKIGAYYVGFPGFRNVYEYKFKWSEIRTVSREGKDLGTAEIWPREELTNFIFIKPVPYAIIVDRIMTKDMIPVKTLITITIHVNNPFLALFATASWFQQVVAVVDRVSRNFIANHTYFELRSEETDGKTASSVQAGSVHSHDSAKPGESLAERIIALTNQLLGEELPIGLKGHYGVSISAADLRWLGRQDDTDHRIADAQVLPFIAEQEKTAAITRAEGEARAAELLGEGEAKALEHRLKVMQNYDHGALLAQCDAMVASSKGPGNTLLWANNPFIQQNYPGLGEVLDKAGIKTPEALRQFMEQRGISLTAAAASAPTESNTGATT